MQDAFPEQEKRQSRIWDKKKDRVRL